MRKKLHAITKFLIRVGDLPVHILAFRLFPAIFIATCVATAVVMYGIFFIQNIVRWTGDSLDKLQALISVHGF